MTNFRHLFLISLIPFIFLQSRAETYRWAPQVHNKKFLSSLNWYPAINPAGAHSSDGLADFVVGDYSVCAAAVIDENLSMSYATINAGKCSSGNGVINFLSGVIITNRVQAGIENSGGTLNIYGGAGAKPCHKRHNLSARI